MKAHARAVNGSHNLYETENQRNITSRPGASVLTRPRLISLSPSGSVLSSVTGETSSEFEDASHSCSRKVQKQPKRKTLHIKKEEECELGSIPTRNTKSFTRRKKESPEDGIHWARRLKSDNANKELELSQLRSNIGIIRGENKQLHEQIRQLQERLNRHREINPAVFDQNVDEVSVTEVRAQLEMLNYLLDHFSSSLRATAHDAAASSTAPNKTHIPLSSNYKLYQDRQSRLCEALFAYGERMDYSGMIVDAILHHLLILQLNFLYFSGDVLAKAFDPGNLLSDILKILDKTESWSIAQRWSSFVALAAANAEAPFVRKHNQIVDEAKADLTQLILELFAIQHRLPVMDFEPLRSHILTQLADIHKLAMQLCLTLRGDLLTVRANVECPKPSPTFGNFPAYNPEDMAIHWPNLGERPGDELISVIHFGLTKRNSSGEMTFIMKPRVLTISLIQRFSEGITF
ncbi:hypothetical protein MIND_01298600 [Mycena indigotica]|uniref:Uncharacterized protein n=1 Tax=Mycena indigotica TaxID=2126181 RepID=A0A8H6RZI5_9AGAR|nr:uncharacterized protein MIND_01298600 [Mycena indigotica]KAF7290585.1 hypothetical protein MIND_01298600 [Mycena indigotica]